MRDPRIVATLSVTYERLGVRVTSVSEDVSRRGLFVRTTEFLPVGEVLDLIIQVGDDASVTVVCRVAHVLSEPAARSLGRQPGMGFQFLEEDPARLYKLHLFLDDVLEPNDEPKVPVPPGTRVVVADGSTRLLERLSTALGHAGFRVRLVPNGAEAFAICLDDPPDVLLTADVMEIIDGWTLIRRFRGHPALSEVPIVLMSEEGGDLTRLNAYRAGVTQFVQKPFTDEEIVLRLSTATRARKRTSEHVILRGRIAEVGLSTLFMLLDFERKSGMLILLNGGNLTTVFVASGRIVKIEPLGADQKPVDRIMELLDIKDGTFEFIVSDVVGVDEVDFSTQHLLIEHARIRDETGRDGGDKS